MLCETRDKPPRQPTLACSHIPFVNQSVSGTANVQPPGNWLGPGGWLATGDERVSTNRRYRLRNQTDGNLVQYVDGWFPMWWSGAGEPGTAYMQDDGNLVLYRNDGTTWDTATNGNDGAHLVVQNDGNTVIYADLSAGGGLGVEDGHGGW